MALAHKIVHTFEKMDAINPTFELVHLHLYRPKSYLVDTRLSVIVVI